MRLDNYGLGAYEPLESFQPEGGATSLDAQGEAMVDEPVVEEAPSQLLREMAQQPPAVVWLPAPNQGRQLPRLDDGDRWALQRRESEAGFEPGGGDAGELPNTVPPDGSEMPPPELAVSPPASEPAPAPAPATTPEVAVAVADTVALPLGPAVGAGWLHQREAALQGMRADFEAAREAARGAPPPDVANAAGTGWVPSPTDGDGNPANGALFVPDAAATAAAAEPVPAWRWRDDGGMPAPQGQWLSFDDAAFEQSYRERLAAQPDTSAPLGRLANLYGEPVQGLLASHPDLWTLATQEHALNAGAPPRPGVAMGDALTLGQLDLYLADPFVTQLRTELGGTPAAPGSGLALEQQRLYGAERHAELTQLSQAMAAVRQQHAAAMQAARDGGGTGWVDVPMKFGTDPETGWPTGIYATVGDGEIQRDAQGVPVLATQRVFDEAVFTNAWLAEGGLAQEAFGRFYGQAHSQIALQNDNSESGGPPRWVSQPSLDNPHVGLGDGGVWDGDLVSLDLNRAPRLNNDAAVGFDPQLGWVTSQDNIHQHRSWFDKAMPIVMVAFVSWATAGAATAAGWGAIGSAAAAGAAASFTSGAINGNLSLKGVLVGAVSGALTAGLTPGLTRTLQDAGLGASSGIAARMTVQGGIQALLGGSFKDGAIAGFATGLAELTSTNIKASIDQAVATGAMSASEALAARTFNTMLGSAIRAAGSPDDPAHAFAQDWLGALMQENLPPVQAPAPAPATGEGDGVHASPVPDPEPGALLPLPPAPQAEQIQAAQASLDELAQQYGGLDQVPASVLRGVLQPVLPQAQDVDDLPPTLEPTLVAGLDVQGIWSESTKNIAIAGGYVAGLFQGVGDTVIGLGKLADTLLKAQLYVSGLGEVGPGRFVPGGREAYQDLGKISAAVGAIARDPGFYLGRAIDHEVSSVTNSLDVANASDARGDWFLYGAAVGRVTFDFANLVLGAGALAESATAVAAKLDAFVKVVNATRTAEAVATVDLSRSGIGAVQELQGVTPTASGNISATRFNHASYSLIDLTPAERNAALQVMTQGDQAGTVTEGLVNSISQRQGWNSIEGGKYGSNNGFDHVLKQPDGTVTILLDSKQITNGSTTLSPDAAGGTMQMSDAWVRQVLNNLDPTSEAYRVVNSALNNGTLVKGVIGVDRASGHVTMIRVN